MNRGAKRPIAPSAEQTSLLDELENVDDPPEFYSHKEHCNKDSGDCNARRSVWVKRVRLADNLLRHKGGSDRHEREKESTTDSPSDKLTNRLTRQEDRNSRHKRGDSRQEGGDNSSTDSLTDSSATKGVEDNSSKNRVTDSLTTQVVGDDSSTTDKGEKTLPPPPTTKDRGRCGGLQDSTSTSSTKDRGRGGGLQNSTSTSSSSTKDHGRCRVQDSSSPTIRDRGRCGGVQDSTTSPSTCHLCHKVYKNKWSLTTHLRAIHKDVSQNRARMPCLEPGCCFRAGRIARLITHLIRAHKMKFECEKVTFRDKEDFWKWKKDAEERCHSSYSAPTSAKRTVSGDMKYFLRCSRSGYAKGRVVEIGEVEEEEVVKEEGWEVEESGGKGWGREESRGMRWGREEGGGGMRGGGEEVEVAGGGRGVKREVEVEDAMERIGSQEDGLRLRREERDDRHEGRKEWAGNGQVWAGDGQENGHMWTGDEGRESGRKLAGYGRDLRRSSSGKINAVCTSFMVATFAREGGAAVHFCRTHYGHALDSHRLKMTQKERVAIKSLILAGHSASEIMATLKASLPVHRHHVVKYANIYNIASRENLHLIRGRDLDGGRLRLLATTQAILARSDDDLLEVEREVEVEEEVEIEVEVEGAVEEWAGDSDPDTTTIHLGHNPSDKTMEAQVIGSSQSHSEPTITSLQGQVMSKLAQVSTLAGGLTSRIPLTRLNENLDSLLGNLESDMCIELVPDEVENSRTDIVVDRDVVGNDIMLFCSDRPIDDFEILSSKEDAFGV